MSRGAVALVVQRPLRLGVPEIVVEDVRAAIRPCRTVYGDPTAELEVVGVTGTTGRKRLVRALLDGSAVPGCSARSRA